MNSEYHDTHRLIIFLHIPKTAGSTLRHIIEHQYGPVGIYLIDGFRTLPSLDEFKTLPKRQRNEIRVLIGHVSFGIHEYLGQPASYITMLRDPVERIISHYFYVLRRNDHHLHDIVTSRHMSLEDYVSSGINIELDNGQTRLLSGITDVYAVVPYGACQPYMLKLAVENLQRQGLTFGISEEFDESLLQLQRAYGWSRVYYRRENVTHNRPPKEAISERALGMIQEHNALDIELYEFARRLFRQRIAGLGKEFEDDLKSFRLLNQSYGRVYSIASTALKHLRKVGGINSHFKP